MSVLDYKNLTLISNDDSKEVVKQKIDGLPVILVRPVGDTLTAEEYFRSHNRILTASQPYQLVPAGHLREAVVAWGFKNPTEALRKRGFAVLLEESAASQMPPEHIEHTMRSLLDFPQDLYRSQASHETEIRMYLEVSKATAAKLIERLAKPAAQ